MPDSAPELARRAWELHEQAVAVGDYSSATRLLRTCCELTGVLGLQLNEENTGTTKADAFIDLLVALRMELRAQKLWALADKGRVALKALGVVLEDSKTGTTWTWE